MKMISEYDEKIVETYNLDFKATQKEYFKIYIVNVFLSIITLGIYSAWAKVRVKKYFYNSTYLEDSSFDYHANPKKILIGRILVVIFLVVTSLLEQQHLINHDISNIFFLLIIPYIVVKAIKFDMNNSSYRNIRFGFINNFKESYKIFLLFGFLGSVLSFGLLYPYFVTKRQEFLINNRYYGENKFKVKLSAKIFYKIYLKFIFAFLIIVSLVGFGVYKLNFMNLLNNHNYSSYKHLSKNQNTTIKMNNKHQVLNYEEYKNRNILIALFSILIIFLYIIIYYISYAYLNAQTINYTLNNTILNGVRFQSSLSSIKLMKLYLINFILIILTLGFYIPFAKFKLVQYRLSTIKILITDNTSEFSTSEIPNDISAFSQEYSDYLNIDFGL